MCVITKDKVDYLRNYGLPNQRGMKEKSYKYPRGATKILTEVVTNLKLDDAMDLS